MKNNKGFTLVELLVVIAIIAVLSAIAIVNLNSARNKGNDASIKANLAALPAAGEVYYDDNSTSYASFCTATSINGVEQNITNSKGAAGWGCADSATAWVAWGQLQDTEGGSYDWHCIDSTGFQISSSTDSATSTFNTDVACQ